MLVVPPPSFKETKIHELVHSMMRVCPKSAAGVPVERIVFKSMIWMPYYRIQYEYRRSENDLIQKFGETAQSETAVNAMLCGCAKNESELLMLFRPNYLKHKMVTRFPQSGEISGSTIRMDFDAVLSDLLRKLNKAKDEFRELRSTLNKRYARIRRYSMMLPMMGDLKEARTLSEKTAKLSTLTNILSMCLNLSEDAESIKALYTSTFYYPTVAVTLKHTETGAKRFLIIDLVKRGVIRKGLSCENGITRICNENDACREALARSIAQASSST